MQEVQVVAEVEQLAQGEVQSRQEDPLSHFVAMQEVHVVAEVEQLAQGEVQLAHAEPSQKVPAPH